MRSELEIRRAIEAIDAALAACDECAPLFAEGHEAAARSLLITQKTTLAWVLGGQLPPLDVLLDNVACLKK